MMGLSDGLKRGMKGGGEFLGPGLTPAKQKTLINHTQHTRTMINSTTQELLSNIELYTRNLAITGNWLQ